MPEKKKSNFSAAHSREMISAAILPLLQVPIFS